MNSSDEEPNYLKKFLNSIQYIQKKTVLNKRQFRIIKPVRSTVI